MRDNIKPIAFYLPQYHPIPENDAWWGKGFTEWTNVAKAKPLFEGHWQPRLPADLGFYDLRVEESRIAQAELAKQYGIYGFCYWHYWFAGKQILERPLQEVVASGQPDFPFCVAWANQTWKGTWHGLSNDQVLVEQTYPGEEDYIAHFYSLLEVFKDPRYVEVEGKKMFMVFQPHDISDNGQFIDCWQRLAIKEGFKGFHFVGLQIPQGWVPQNHGYQTHLQGMDPWVRHVEKTQIKRDLLSRIKRRLKIIPYPVDEGPRKVLYDQFVNYHDYTNLKKNEYPLVCVDWDNTPRSGKEGWLFKNFSIQLFQQHCLKAFCAAKEKPENEQFVFIKSWNEWAEGNYLEPDQKHGHGYLQAIKDALTEAKNSDKNFQSK